MKPDQESYFQYVQLDPKTLRIEAQEPIAQRPSTGVYWIRQEFEVDSDVPISDMSTGRTSSGSRFIAYTRVSEGRESHWVTVQEQKERRGETLSSWVRERLVDEYGGVRTALSETFEPVQRVDIRAHTRVLNEEDFSSDYSLGSRLPPAQKGRIVSSEPAPANPPELTVIVAWAKALPEEGYPEQHESWGVYDRQGKQIHSSQTAAVLQALPLPFFLPQDLLTEDPPSVPGNWFPLREPARVLILRMYGERDIWVTAYDGSGQLEGCRLLRFDDTEFEALRANLPPVAPALELRTHPELSPADSPMYALKLYDVVTVDMVSKSVTLGPAVLRPASHADFWRTPSEPPIPPDEDRSLLMRWEVVEHIVEGRSVERIWFDLASSKIRLWERFWLLGGLPNVQRVIRVDFYTKFNETTTETGVHDSMELGYEMTGALPKWSSSSRNNIGRSIVMVFTRAMEKAIWPPEGLFTAAYDEQGHILWGPEKLPRRLPGFPQMVRSLPPQFRTFDGFAGALFVLFPDSLNHARIITYAQDGAVLTDRSAEFAVPRFAWKDPPPRH